MNKLLNYYLETDYLFYVGGKSFKIEINKKNEYIQQIDGLENAHSFAFLTAWNPYSQELDLMTNKQRNVELQRKIQELNRLHFLAVGKSKDSSWKEESFLILNISLREAYRLASHYEQNAFLYGKIFSHTRLIWLRY